MKVKRVVEDLEALEINDCELLIALPGGRFSPVTLIEPFTKVDGNKEVKVGIIYPHPRDVSGPAAAPTSERSEWAKGIDAVFDFFEGASGKKEDADGNE
jgi:hypothetical protein